MIKLLSVLLLFSFNVLGATKWQKHYAIVNKDIKTVEALKTKDLMLRVRLFELYGEKLTLLLDKENEYRMKFVETGKKKGLRNVLNLQKKTLNKIEKIARKIERQTKNRKILTKVYYYRALNFYLVKKYKLFYKNIKKAERINKDKSIAYVIHTKLADYHYNEKHYKQAIKYYKKLLYKKKNKWLTKVYYNLAWSQLKTDQYKSGLVNVKKAHALSKKKGYFQIGEQLIDSVLLFYAYSRKTQEGLQYMLNHDIKSFDYMLKYLHYVFENGSKKSSAIVINHLNQMKLTANQEYQLLTKKILVYRTLKRFTSIQRDFKAFKKRVPSFKKQKIDEKYKSELINAIRSYTGYLQELVKSKSFVKEKRKKLYVRYTAYNFNVLKVVDSKNALEYNYYEGETYFSMGNYRRAAFVYTGGISKYKKKTRKTNNKFLPMTFDSLFKSLEKLKNPPGKTILFAYNGYLYFYPTGPKSAEIYQRLINFYRSKNNEKKMFSALKRYNKHYPQDIKKQRAVYKDILNKYIKKEDIASLKKLKKLVQANFLKFTQLEILKLDKIISQIYFSKYEDLAKQGKYKEANDGFMALYNDEKNEYKIRFNALLKKMFYENKIYDFESLTSTYQLALKFFKNKEKKKHSEEFLYYAQNICVSDLHKDCILLTNKIKQDSAIKITTELENLSFKVFTIYNDVDSSIFAKANNLERKSYLFKFLLIEDPSFTTPMYNEMYKIPSLRKVIDPSVTERFWRIFYSSLDLNKLQDFTNKIVIPSIKSKLSGLIQIYRTNIGTSKFNLPAPPKVKEITFEVFQKFNMNLENTFVSNVNAVNASIGQIHPNFLPQYLSNLVANFEKESQKIKSYIPVSKDPDLEKAISNRVLELSKILDLKLIEYRTLYHQSIDKSQKGIGAQRYFEDIIDKQINYGLGRITPWQK